MTFLKKLAGNHAVAYEKAKNQFLEQVIFQPFRNRYFTERYERAMNAGYYELENKVIQGQYKEIKVTLVKNLKNGKVYAVRILKKEDYTRGLASCTCPDFQRNKDYKVPCKHIWKVLEDGQ